MEIQTSALASLLEIKAAALEARAQVLRSSASVLREEIDIRAEATPKRAAKPAPKKPATRKQVRRATQAKASATKRQAPVSDDAPRAGKGRLPKAGVQQLYCEDEAARKAKVSDLKADGYRRVGPGVPLASGTYDVRPSGDGDASSVVLWRESASENTN